MYTYLDQMIERGRVEGWAGGKAEGIAEGVTIGEKKERNKIISKMLTINPLDTVVALGGFSYDEVKSVYDHMIREDQTPYGL